MDELKSLREFAAQETAEKEKLRGQVEEYTHIIEGLRAENAALKKDLHYLKEQDGRPYVETEAASVGHGNGD